MERRACAKAMGGKTYEVRSSKEEENSMAGPAKIYICKMALN
jgi:hypothetical protein